MTGGRVFRDREEAGRALAEALAHLRGQDVVVLGLPRGGVPVAAEVARALAAPLDVFVVRKLGVPGHEELAMGAVASGGATVLNKDLIAGLGLTTREVELAARRETEELRRRELAYRGRRGSPPLADKTVVLVDDGLATGATIAAAARALGRRGPGRIVVAVPVGAAEGCRSVGQLADEVVCLQTPLSFRAVGEWYRDFHQVPDEEVRRLLADSASGSKPGAAEGPGPAAERLELELDGHVLPGELTVPSGAGLVLFAHGSGSSHGSPRNRMVAGELQRAGLATLLFDLLDEREASRRELVFDIRLLASRLLAVTRWTQGEPALADLPVGYFGASTGAAAALLAAAELGERVRAVVSRGGRPDLAGAPLAQVTAPTLLIVGGADREVLELNRRAMSELRCPHELAVVEGAGHLFEEPGALEQVAQLAVAWLERHLQGTGPREDESLGKTAA